MKQKLYKNKCIVVSFVCHNLKVYTEMFHYIFVH